MAMKPLAEKEEVIFCKNPETATILNVSGRARLTVVSWNQGGITKPFSSTSWFLIIKRRNNVGSRVCLLGIFQFELKHRQNGS